MEYESDRSMIEMKMEDAKQKAAIEAEKYNLVGDIPDPNWVQPVETGKLVGVGLGEAQEFWINGGKTGGLKEEQVVLCRDFRQDLPGFSNIFGDGTFREPANAEQKLTPAEIEERMKAHNFSFPEMLPTLAYYVSDEKAEQS